MHTTKRLDLMLLETELTAAGVPHNALGHTGTDTDGELFTYDAAGGLAELPPAAVPVVDAHAAPLPVVEYAGARSVDAIVRTTDAVPREVFRFPTGPKRVYRADLGMTAIDAGNGTTRDSEVRLVFKHAGGQLAQVGATVVLSNAQDAAAAAWRIQAAPDGTDLVVTVTGAAGRTIDWLLRGQVGTYAPDGLDG